MASACRSTLFCSFSYFLLLLNMVIQLGQSCPGSFNFNCSVFYNFNNGEFPSAHFTNAYQYDQACGHLCKLVCFYGNMTIKCNDKHEEPPYSVIKIKPKDLTIIVDYPPWFVPPGAPTYDPCKTYLDLSSSIPLFQSVSFFIDGPGENETFIGCPSNPDWDKYRGQANKKDCGSAVDGDHAIVYGPYDYGQLPKGNPPPTGCMQFHNTYLSAAEAKGKSRTLLILVVVLSVIAVGVAILIVIIITWRRRNSKTGLRPLPSRVMSLNHTTSDLEDGSTNNGVTVFSYAELQEVTNNFDPATELGQGGFGVVYHGKLKDGREVAVKRMFEKNYNRIEQFKNEIEILTNARHPNLVTLYGSTSRHTRELLLVYEFIPNGTLADHLHGHQSKSVLLLWPTRLNIAIQTASALCYLHHNDIIHRDIKTNNILLDKTFVAKVADFGLSRLFPSDVSHVSTAPQGTPGYLDPEYHQCYHLTDRSDVYSFGVVLVELISSMEAVDLGRERHEVNLANYAMNRIQRCEFGELVDSNLGFEKSFKVRRMTSLVAELAFRCLQHEREIRPSMEEVLEALKSIESVDYDGLEGEEMG